LILDAELLEMGFFVSMERGDKSPTTNLMVWKLWESEKRGDKSPTTNTTNITNWFCDNNSETK
jgi:hypothetical protein